MGDKFNYKKLNQRDFKGMQQAAYQIESKKKEMIKLIDIENIVKALEETALKKGEKAKIMIRGMNGTGMRTLKGYNENLEEKYEDDYFLGRVKDTTKFSNYYQLQIYIQKQK
jgi:predicted DNA-binding antitoxin AbrB/MazE fold protein